MKNQGQGVAEGRPPDVETVRDFISMAVHDLREPLRSIRLGSRMLTVDKGDSPEGNTDRGARLVLDGVERIETLIHDIAEYCYEEAREPSFGDTDLETVLLQAQSELAGEIRSSGASLSHDPLPTVTGSFSSLTSVLRCLIGNACKFGGGTPPEIHVGAVQQRSEWIVSVRDNGMGFDPAYRDRIFRPFERLNGKQYPGSGLGLTLAQRIVQKHGGHIWAESKAGEGSTFRFSLPVTR